MIFKPGNLVSVVSKFDLETLARALCRCDFHRDDFRGWSVNLQMLSVIFQTEPCLHRECHLILQCLVNYILSRQRPAYIDTALTRTKKIESKFILWVFSTRSQNSVYIRTRAVCLHPCQDDLRHELKNGGLRLM